MGQSTTFRLTARKKRSTWTSALPKKPHHETNPLFSPEPYLLRAEHAAMTFSAGSGRSWLTCRVVTSVLQPLQSLHQRGQDLLPRTRDSVVQVGENPWREDERKEARSAC